MSTIIKAAWAILVSRYSDTDEAIYGLTLSGRNAPVPGIATMVGATITTVPLRIKVDRQETVSDFLQNVQQQSIDMIPFEHAGIQNISLLSPDAKYACEFQSLLVIQPASSETDSTIHGVEIESNLSANFQTYGILMECHLGKESIRIDAQFSTGSISEVQVQRLMGQFHFVLRQLNNEISDDKIGDISTFCPQDLEQVNSWNSPPVEPVMDCIHSIIEQQTRTRPNAQAVAAWDTNLTYIQLDQLSNRLAKYLIKLGVGIEMAVPMCMEKSAIAIVAMLGIFKAGGVLVALDVTQPKSRLEELVCQVGATIALVSPGEPSLRVGAVREVVEVTMSLLQALPAAEKPLLPVGKPEDAAYILFTSGSTGKPKGVVIDHRAISTSTAGHGARTNMNTESRVLQFASFMFDASMAEILATLVNGGCVCVPSEHERTNSIVPFMREMEVTWAFFTPSSIRKLFQPDDVPSLKTLVLGGEALSSDVVETWADKVDLFNGFGPTECTVFCNIQALSPGVSPKTIGRAVSSLSWVVDTSDHNKLAPIGCSGELLVEGPIVARGYLDDEEQTAKVFIIDPDWSRDSSLIRGRVFYKTGDLVRYNDDGSLSVLGRKDYQVKLRGQRLELGEIENRLWLQGHIKNVVVVLAKSGPCKDRLVAVISLSKLQQVTQNKDTEDLADKTTMIRDVSSKPEEETLKIVSKVKLGNLKSTVLAMKDDLSDHIPSYMVPTLWFVVEDIPLGSTGKTNRKIMEQWVVTMGQDAFDQNIDDDEVEDDNSPTTAMATRLLKVWSSVLNVPVDQIPQKKSFLSLGGDSITAMQVVARCREAGITVSMQDILRSKSIARLASHARFALAESSSYHEEVFDAPFDLTPIQQMYRSVGGMERQESAHFNQSFTLNISRRVDPADVGDAIELIVKRHSMLRARFTQADSGGWTQSIPAEVKQSYLYKVYDTTLGDVPSLVASTQQRLDIENGPVFAVDLFNVDNEQILFLVAHHLVVDLVSWRVILGDLEVALGSQESLTAQPPFPFQVWAELQADYAKANLDAEAVLPFKVLPPNLEYWGAVDMKNTYGDVIQERFQISKELTSVILEGCNRTLNTKTEEILLAVLLQSFQTTFKDRTVPTVYTEGHGREAWDPEIDLSSTVGWFTVMTPLHIAVDNDLVQTIRLTKDVRRSILGNEWSYFTSRFLNKTGYQALGNNATVEILFNYLGRYQQLERTDSLLQFESRIAGSDVGSNVPRMGLFEFGAVVAKGQLQFSLTYNKNLKHQEAIRQWTVQFQSTLVEAADLLVKVHNRCTLSDFPLLSQSSYKALDELTLECLPAMGISSVEEIEDVYPCSPIQQGLLLSQMRAAGAYEVSFMFQVISGAGTDFIDIDRFIESWQAVVSRHAMLRTMFVKKPFNGDSYTQVVLRNREGRVLRLNSAESSSEASEMLNKQLPMDYSDNSPPHQVTLYENSSKELFFKLEISHTLIDAFSMLLIFGDLAHAYDGKSFDKEAPLYSDYVAYQQNQPLEAATEYWKGYLADVKPCQFPVLDDGLENTRQLRNLRLDLGVFEELQTFCLVNEVTLATLFQTAWGLVLQAYTGTDDVCFGYLNSGRDIPVMGADGIVGPLINMLVCRVNKSKDKSSLSQLARKMHADYLQNLSHKQLPLMDIQHSLKLGTQALFNTTMSFQTGGSRENAPENPGVSFKAISGHDPTEYDITVAISAHSNEVFALLGFWTSILSDGQAANVLSSLKQAIHMIVHRSDVRVDEFCLFSERNSADLAIWNSLTTCPEMVHECVHDVFKKQVEASPHGLAVYSNNCQYTYRQLDDLATHLSTLLQSLGVGPEVLVPLCFSNSAYMIVAAMGVLKAGGAFVPLDTSQPIGRLEKIINQTKAPIILMENEMQLALSIVHSKIVVSATMLEDLAGNVGYGKPAEPGLTPKNLAYIIFTSGSTGEPKGVMVPHYAICSSMASHGAAMKLGPKSRVLQFASISFDASVAEILTTLTHGGCVCIPSKEERTGDLSGVINRMDVNWAFFTPSVVKLIRRPGDVPGLKTLVLGGEAIKKDHVETWGGKVDLINGYGPTETVIFCVCQPIEGPQCSPHTIGRSLSSRSWICDPEDHNRLTPVGCVGELLVEGALARGYLDDDERTDKAFIHDPAWSIGQESSGRRFYKTGDLVRYNSNGTMNYLGRKDNQVKLRGQRLELGEVEYEMMSRMPVGTQVAVEICSVPSRPDDQTLVAFFTSSRDHNDASIVHGEIIMLPMLEDIRSSVIEIETALLKVLPSYMIPSVFIPVAEMPLNTSQKLDRKKLQQAGQMDPQTWLSYSLTSVVKREPSTDMERKLHTLWVDVLGVDTALFGADDSFFRLGGDSISAVRLTTAASQHGVQLSVADIFGHPRLADMAKMVQTTTDDIYEVVEPFELLGGLDSEKVAEVFKVAEEEYQIDQALIQDIYPCTTLQEGLLALSAKQPGAYVARNVIRLPETLDTVRFKGAWESLVESTEILRTRILSTPLSGSVQVVLRDTIMWQTSTSLETYIDMDKKIPVGYGTPLARYCLVRDGSDLYFVWTAHHAIYDGWSIGLIFSNVVRIYESGQQESITPFVNFMKSVQSVSSTDSDNFWKAQLEGARPSTFLNPAIGQHHPRTSGMVKHTMDIDRKVSSITMSTVIRSAWAIVVSRYSGRDEATFGATLTGRNAPVKGISSMVGPTLTTVPLRIAVDYAEPVSQFLVRVQKQSIDMIPFEQAGIQNIRRLSTDANVACGFQNLLVVQPVAITSEDVLRPLGIEVVSAAGPNFHTEGLLVECHMGKASVEIEARYSGSAISQEHLQRLMYQFQHIIRVLNNESDESIGSMMLLSPYDEMTILDWNKHSPEVVDDCLHLLFQEQVALRPDAQAICTSVESLTYRELDIISSRFALHLQKLGVGAGVLVPVCAEKSLYTIVVLLGILKAGAAFVPLDASLPPLRLQEIILQTGARLAITSSGVCLPDGIVETAMNLSQAMENLPIMDIDSVIFSENSPKSTAYVIFTSGSSGTPKGVVMDHGAVCSSVRGHGNFMKFDGSNLRVLQFASYSFDASIAEIFTTLSYGGCVCSPTETERLDDIAGFMNATKVNWAFFTPSFIKLLHPKDVPTLQTLVLGGEAMRQENIDVWAGKVDLMNGFGPTETCIFCVSQLMKAVDGSAGYIGRAVSSVTWVVDPTDHNQLVPVGCIGELLVEGPSLARGYLNNSTLTDAAFITDPKWSLHGRGAKDVPRRFYKTGDLVHYSDDGSLIYIGRKDSQVKLRGQRMELGEIEHRLWAYEQIQNAVVVLPKAGYCERQVVAVIALRGLGAIAQDESSVVDLDQQVESDLVLVTKSRISAIASKLLPLYEHIADALPTYMVPTKWFIVESIPLNSNGKTDRRKVNDWVTNLSRDMFDQSLEPQVEESSGSGTQMDKRLLQVWSQVLNIPVKDIPLNGSFLSLGGDSITAMQIVARCRARGITISVQDIMRSKTIARLALCARSSTEPTYEQEEIFDTPFNLSPIQQMYSSLGSMSNQGTNQFNQSFLIRVSRRIESEDLARAVEGIVRLHSMLRARFEKSPENGTWSQIVSAEVENSYKYEVHGVSNSVEVETVVATVQRSIDIEQGPVFAVALLNFEQLDEGQLIFMTAHHLVVDMVSWRIILQNMEEALTSPETFGTDRPFPFQAWCAIQEEHARKNLSPSKALQFGIAPADMDYWGMADGTHGNTYADVTQSAFTIDSEITTLLLTESNGTLRTEVIELFLAALFQSFHETFLDRDTPTIFGEGHGREPWDPEIDLSRTVGWFTTMAPIHISLDNDIVHTVRATKDARRRLADNGWAYFTSRFLNPEGIKTLGGDSTAEILFNYLGQYQQFEKTDAMFQLEPRGSDPAAADIGPAVPRFALFEVSAVVAAGQIQFSFMYNKHMKHQDKILEWIARCETALRTIPAALMSIDTQYTLSDFPLLNSLTYDGLEELMSQRLTKIGVVRHDTIEDIYPCSPMQDGLLLSQKTGTGSYEVHFLFQVLPHKGKSIEVDRFINAWQEVIKRHALLRTVFIRSVCGDGLSHQVVLKHIEGKVLRVSCDEHDVLETLNTQARANFSDNRPPHRLIVCVTASGQVFCKLEISHTLIDAISMSIIVRDLGLAYESEILEPPAALYSDYVSFLGNRSEKKSLDYWASYLKDITTCYFPTLSDHRGPRNLRSVAVNIDAIAELRSFCTNIEVTVANILQAVWGLVLHCYSGSDDVSFGYLASGRDVPVHGIHDIVGPFINMMVCRLSITQDASLKELVKTVQANFMSSLDHQHTSLADIQHALKLGRKPLFNTIMSFQGALSKVKTAGHEPGITLESIGAHDPSEYDITVNIAASDDLVHVKFSYWNSILSDEEAENMASLFSQFTSALVGDPTKKIHCLDTICENNKTSLLQWNSSIIETVDDLVHSQVERQAKERPDSMAVCGWDGEFTYHDLDDFSTRLGNHLIGLGVGPEILVPLCMEKSVWTIVAMIGVLKAGGAFVPLDPSHPRSRLEDIVSQTGANVMIVSPGSPKLLGVGSIEIILELSATVNDWLLSTPEAEPVQTDVASNNMAYAIFTSGSTGKPKGVIIEHITLCSSMAGHEYAMKFDSESRVLQFSSYAFDASIAEIFTTLTRGGCVCVPSEKDRMNNLSGFINEMEVNWVFCTPSLARLIRPDDAPTVKTLVVGGEPMRKEVIEIWTGNDVTFIQAYGPTECCIFSMTSVIEDADAAPENIGQALDCATWVVDPADHNRLVPIGCPGELLIDGPLVARGYLNNQKLTDESFVSNPAWCTHLELSPRRLYKTGDLVQYNADGTLNFIGRKDNQVKLRGQRFELGDIETKLWAYSDVQNAVVVLPKSGICKQRVVAVLSLQHLSPESSMQENGLDEKEESEINIVHQADLGDAVSEILAIWDDVSNQLPSYMVPTIWFVVESFPLGLTGKLDRKKVEHWVQNMSQETFDQNVRDGAENPENGELVSMSSAESRLREVWSLALNIPVEQVSMNKSFLTLGGDSIAAMQVVARCRAAGVFIMVQDILRSKSISALASCVRTAGHDSREEEDYYDRLLDLSPIQQFYCSTSGMRNPSLTHFNQSFLLQLTATFSPRDVARAIEAVVQRHSMLRARFVENEGVWNLLVPADIAQSYQYNTYKDVDSETLQSILAATQKELNIETGPIFAVDFFELADNTQILFLVAHHLVIDLVSWRIILKDVEDVLQTGKVSPEEPFSFPKWISLQAAYGEKHQLPSEVLCFEVIPENVDYWGMTNFDQNTYGNANQAHFTLDAELTSLLLRDCHTALQTEPTDILVGCLIHSFGKIFTNRTQPSIFIEHDGRKPGDDEIDLSNTVGWFTTMYPVTVSTRDDDSVQTIKRTKDIRRRIPRNGWPYFSSQFHNSEGIEHFKSQSPMEILFNYIGQHQPLERKSGLLQIAPDHYGSLGDVGANVQRLSLFEVSALISEGTLKVSVNYVKYLQHQEEITLWLRGFEMDLCEAIYRLKEMQPHFTLSDFPLLPLTYENLDALENGEDSSIGASMDQIEEMYPCSHMQEEILDWQHRNPGCYRIMSVFEVTNSNFSTPIDVSRLEAAWQSVINRHAILRAFFVKSVCRESRMDQVVLKKYRGRTSIVKRDNTSGDLTFDDLEKIDYLDGQPPHQLTICEVSDGAVYCIIDLSHSLLDASSTAILQHDLVLAYEGKLSSRSGPRFSDYVSQLQLQARGPAYDYWKDYLTGVTPSFLPHASGDPSDESFGSLLVELETASDIQQFCKKKNLLVSSLLQGAWALVLASCLDSESVCFGYTVSGRDAHVANAYSTIGPLYNVLMCHAQLRRVETLKNFLNQVHSDVLAGIPYQISCIRDIVKDLGSNWPPFNTVINMAKYLSESEVKEEGVSIKTVTGQGLMEYDMTVSVYDAPDSVSVSLSYRRSAISDTQAATIGNCLNRILTSVVRGNYEAVDDLIQNVYNSEDMVGKRRVTNGTA